MLADKATVCDANNLHIHTNSQTKSCYYVW